VLPSHNSKVVGKSMSREASDLSEQGDCQGPCDVCDGALGVHEKPAWLGLNRHHVAVRTHNWR
jgi:hypothetical protein